MMTGIVHLDFAVTPQPSETTCGPASLHAVYRYMDDPITLEEVVEGVQQFRHGGTIAVMLGLHAISRGYDVTIYTCDLQMFDPTWFQTPHVDLGAKLREQASAKDMPTLHTASQAYGEYLSRGGRVLMEDVDASLLERLLSEGCPIIAGLSATWLYQCMRERPENCQDDDIHGSPCGHFLVLHGIHRLRREVEVADPYLHKPYPGSHYYRADVRRVLNAIMLGIVTYDAKLLVLRRRSDPPA
jgi:hypothetical protein